MNSRQRFQATMKYGKADRVPYFEEGIRSDVLLEWRKEGMPEDLSLSELFRTDRQEELDPEVGPLPEPRKWPRDLKGLKDLKARFDPSDPRRLPADWSKRVKAWRNRDHVLMLRVHRGLFQTLGISDWTRFEEVIYLLKDNTEFVHGLLSMHGEFLVALIDRILDEVEVDAAIFSEPIGGNSGPLISPKMYEEIALSRYEPVLAALRRRGVETIIFRTYANSRILIPSIMRWGFTCLWACEVEVDSMDYLSIRQEYGRDLRLIGGIDLDTLLEGEEAIRVELTSKVPKLLEQGGYVPLADGRVRKGVPFQRYAYYRKMLEEIIEAERS